MFRISPFDVPKLPISLTEHSQLIEEADARSHSELDDLDEAGLYYSL